MKSYIIRICLFALAILFFLLALISVPTPLPIGIVFFAIGAAILITVSETVKNKLHDLRFRFPKFDNSLILVEKYMPGPLRRALQSSMPKRVFPTDQGDGV